MTLKDIVKSRLEKIKSSIDDNYIATAIMELKAALEDLNKIYEDEEVTLHQTFRFNEKELVDNFINYWKKYNVDCVPSSKVIDGSTYEFMLSFKKGDAGKVKELVKIMDGELIK